MREMISLERATQIAAFIPTRRDLSLRIKLQRYVSPSVLARLSPGSLGQLEKCISESDVSYIRSMLSVYSEYLEWLVAPDDFDLDVYEAKKKALDVLTDALDTPDAGDAKIMAVKVKAAEVILKKAEIAPVKVTQNLNIKAVPHVPKHLVSRTEEELEEELRQLQEANKKGK